MKYHIENNTLLIKGNFEAISTGINGGMSKVSCIFNHSVTSDFEYKDPIEYVVNLAQLNDIKGKYFGLLTAVDMTNLCIEENENMTLFVTAGITHPSPFKLKNIGTINIIIVSKIALSKGAMASAIITATEAKSLCLLDLGFDFLGTTTDAVVVAEDKTSSKNRDTITQYTGSYTEFGSDLIKSVKKCVCSSILKTHPEISTNLVD